MNVIPKLLSACGGFLLAVLWFDLMFDVQAMPYLGTGLPVSEEVLASIAFYYARVTTNASPMSNLIGLVMLITLAGCVHQVFRGEGRLSARVAALCFAAAPISLAMASIFPDAVRLGGRLDPPALQGALALSILLAHLFCFASILIFLSIQLSLSSATSPSGAR